MEFPFEKAVSSPEETSELASVFANNLKTGSPVILNGELGSGKTFFVKQTCAAWGINNVNSPTFAIVNSYQNNKSVYHFDFYRIKNKEELYEIGFNDYMNDEGSVIFIEWGNLIPDVLPKKRMEINIEVMDGTKRYFRFKKYG